MNNADRDSEQISDPEQLSDAVRAAAIQSGFDLVGIAPAVTPTGFSDLLKWLDQGYAGEMRWIDGRRDAYEHPKSVLAGVRSIVLLAVNYKVPSSEERPGDSSDMTTHGRVSRYAWGERDYHLTLRTRLRTLADVLHTLRPGVRTRGVVDTAPLLERDFARLAGLGWFGKNTMLINKRAGSWLFLCALLTDLELVPDQPHHTAHCGTCTRCLDACPTDAFPEPWVLDARRCISYLTIELRDAPIPMELRSGVGDWLFGCDVCQDVCPWNNKAPASSDPTFLPVKGNSPTDLIELLQLSGAEFQQRFRDTPLARPRRAGLLRNAAIVLGNLKSPESVPVLTGALSDVEPLIRGAAAWALGEIRGDNALAALRSRVTMESDAEVLREIDDAIAIPHTMSAAAQQYESASANNGVQSMNGKIETRIRELGYELPAAPAAVGAYAPAIRTGNLVITSGQLPFVGREIAFRGKLGAGLHETEGRDAARICVLNALAQIKSLVGDLDVICKVVKLEGYVHSAPGFQSQPQVLNGASEFLADVFGDRGRHTRTAVGVAEMPLNAAVQLALWVEVNA